MTIYDSDNRLILDVDVDDNSYRQRRIMGDHSLTLYYSLARHVEIPVGAYCEYQGARYELLRPTAFKMKHSRQYEYTVTMEAPQAKAKIWKFRNPVDGRLKFPLTAKPKEHLQMFVDNMNRRDSGWTVGDYIESTEKLICYDHDYCWDALSRMAQEFETEFEIVGKRVSLCKVEHNKENPLPLSYGKGNGFKPGVGRSNYGDLPPVEILYVQGGETNIDSSKYGKNTLHLPPIQTLRYDGNLFYDEDPWDFNEDAAREYISDDLGCSIRNASRPLKSLTEDSLDCSEIYPKRVGRVTSVVEQVGGEPNLYDFVDSNIPRSLDYEQCKIAGENMTVIFQSGMLAGREFEVIYHHSSVGGKQAKRFEIIPQEIDGQTMPNEIFKPQPSDEYVVMHCAMPQSYINAYESEDDTKEGAEWDMFRAAVKALYEKEDVRFTFTGELDGIWAKNDWENIGGRILLGGFVLFSDPNFQPDGVAVRIVGIKDYINNPHSPSIELSNETVGASFGSSIKTLKAEEVATEELHRQAIQFTKRRWRDARETAAMLEQALFDKFSASISPIAVNTMQTLVGDESLQFQFVENRNSTTPVAFSPTFDTSTKVFTAPASWLRHLTLDSDRAKSLSSSNDNSDYTCWRLPARTFNLQDSPTKAYYLYAKCIRADSISAQFVLSATPIGMEENDAFYHFLIGILNSEHNGERSFAPMYGMTEILPGRITTDRVVSGNGDSWFDMVHNSMKLGDALDFNSQGDGKLLLKGTIVQSRSGETSPLGCYRGVYDENLTYFNGDEVSYAVGGNTSTYRQVAPNPCVGIAPTTSTHWQVIAQGTQGRPGENGMNGLPGISPNTAFKSIVFIRSNPAPSRPTGGSYPTMANPTAHVPDGWSDGIPSQPEGEVVWCSTRIFSSDGLFPQEGQWSDPTPMTDTADLDICFSAQETMPEAPTTHGIQNDGVWHDTGQPEDIWMATCRKSNGMWGSWSIVKIKGENGENGTSVSIKGRFQEIFQTKSDYLNSPEAVLRGHNYLIVENDMLTEEEIASGFTSKHWVVRTTSRPNSSRAIFQAAEGEGYMSDVNGHLYIADNDGWQDVGEIRGADGNPGENGKNAYVHVKFSRSLTPDDWSANNGDTPDKYIGILTDNNPLASDDWGAYTWSKWQGEDGFGNEYIYKLTTTSQAPDVPDQSPNIDDYVPDGWTDNPSSVSASNPYCWVAHRKKIAGVWTAFSGSSSDPGAAALWAKYGKDGDPGTSYVGTKEFYQWHNSSTTPPQGQWSVDTIPARPADKSFRYLWNFERVFKSNGSTTDTPMHVVGSDGKEVASFSEYYIATNSGITAPDAETAEWTSAMPELTSETPYMWNKEVIHYTDGTSDTKIHLVAQRGDDGERGDDGDDGDYTELRFRLSGSPTYVPFQLSDSILPAPPGWSLETPTMPTDFGYYLWMIQAKKNAKGSLLTAWSNPTRITGEKGDKGDKGEKGDDGQPGKSPAMVFRGDYDPNAVYYGNDFRLDCVRTMVNGMPQYFIAQITAGSFYGHSPAEPDTQYWNPFGASFDSVATQLLLAEYANIAGFIFKNNVLISQRGTVNGADSTDYQNPAFVPNVTIDAVNGVIRQGKNIYIDSDGISLYKDNGSENAELVAKIVNASIGDEVDLENQSAAITSFTAPSVEAVTTFPRTFTYDIPIARLTKKSVLHFERVSVEFLVPTHYSQGNTATQNSMTWYSVTVSTVLLCDNDELPGTRQESTDTTPRATGNKYGISLNVDRRITIGSNGFPEGNYKLRINITINNSNTYNSGHLFLFQPNITPNLSYNKYGFKKTLIGNDGMYSCWGSNIYMYASENGFKFRFGNKQLTVDSNGIKTSDGGRTNSLI